MTLRARRSTIALGAAVALVAACTAGSNDQREVSGVDGSEGPEANMTPTPASDVADAEVAATTTLPMAATTVPSATEPAPTTTTAGIFEADGADEFAVALLLSDEGLGRVQSLPIGPAATRGEQDIVQVGLPFEYQKGDFSTVFQFTGGDLVADIEMFLVDYDSFVAGSADIIIGRNPGVDLNDLTSRAAAGGIPLVMPGYVNDGSVPTQSVRFDIAGSRITQIDLIADRVAAAEFDGVVVATELDDDIGALMIERLLDSGVSASAVITPSESSPEAIAEAAETIVAAGDRVAVVLGPGTSNVALVDAIIERQDDAVVFAGDFSLSRADVASLQTIGKDQIVVIRRANDLSRPEQAEFKVRMIDSNPDLGRIFDAAEVYDMYVLAALATVEAGAASREEIRARIVELSRDGEPCSEPAVCLAFVGNGVDIDYEGLSGPIEFDDEGVATATWFAIDVGVPRSGELVTEEFVLHRV